MKHWWEVWIEGEHGRPDSLLAASPEIAASELVRDRHDEQATPPDTIVCARVSPQKVRRFRVEVVSMALAYEITEEGSDAESA